MTYAHTYDLIQREVIITENNNPSGRRPEQGAARSVGDNASRGVREGSGAVIRRAPAQVRPTVSGTQSNGASGANVGRVPASQSRAVPQSRSVSSGGQNAAGVRRRVPEDGLMKTKTTDLSSISGLGGDSARQARQVSGSSRASSGGGAENVKRSRSEREDDYGGSDEGGNTVVSVIKAVIYIIFVLVISVFLSIAVIAISNDIFAFVKSDEVVEVTIPEYATLDEVADILYRNDIIKYPTVFKLYAVAEHDNGEFLQGTYSVDPMMSYETLLAEFKEKPVSGVCRITIPEGYSTDEIIDLMVENGIGTREGYEDVIQNYEFDYWFITELEESGRMTDRLYRLDGYLFPDTYEFYKNSSEATVINKLLKRFSQIFTREYRDQCIALGYSVDEMITLASIIEKEAAAPSEFFWVSSVFHNRLNNPWSFPRLESDATVLYIIAHDKGERPKTVTPEDLQYETPYNTYKYEGLPPGPIANPSASAMLAALSPVSSNYYYFYYMSSKGSTVYSATKAEHDAYIAQDRQ